MLCQDSMSWDKRMIMKSSLTFRCTMRANSRNTSKESSRLVWLNWVRTMSKRRRATSGKYRIWRAEVLKRDNYTCQGYKYGYDCRTRSNLTAHHIKAWSKYPKDRYKVGNGITLCRDCHDKVEYERSKGHEQRISKAAKTVDTRGNRLPYGAHRRNGAK